MAFDGYQPHDGEVRGAPLASHVRQTLAHEVRLARLRMHHQVQEEQMQIADGAANPDGTSAPSAPALADHIKRQIASYDAGQAGPIATAAVPVTIPGTDADTGAVEDAPAPVSFLERAAARSRELAMARRRNAIAAASAASGTSAEDAADRTEAALAPLDGDDTGSIPTAVESKPSMPRPLSRGGHHIVLRFQEGFTNAVRRPVVLADFVPRAWL